MSKVFTIDGVGYNVIVPAGGIKRSAAILDGENAGRNKAGGMIRDVIGTYYNYTVQIETAALSVDEYDRLYEVLTAPVDSHKIVVPYGQATLSFDAYISNAEDTLDSMVDRNLWTGLSITFTAMRPQRIP